jgi:PilZ domain
LAGRFLAGNFTSESALALAARLKENPSRRHGGCSNSGGKLMVPEKRKEGRSSFPRQPHGKMQLLAGGRTHQVVEVMDVSPMGIRLRVGSKLDIGENVLIRYQGNGVDLKLNGTVVWNTDSPADPNDAADPSSCIIGIQVASPSLLQAFWQTGS